MSLCLFFFFFTSPTLFHAQADIPASEFSEARARTYLESITSLGVRVVGMPSNEDAAPEILMNAAHAIRDANPDVSVDVVRQIASGAYHLNFLDGFSAFYSMPNWRFSLKINSYVIFQSLTLTS